MKRSELFKLLWSQPTSKVAPRFGMSDRGLGKLCERHHIPLPERGYWAKVSAGQYPAMMPLPRPDHDYEIQMKDQQPVEPVEAKALEEPNEAIAQEEAVGVYVDAVVEETMLPPVKRKRGRPFKNEMRQHAQQDPAKHQEIQANETLSMKSEPYRVLVAMDEEFSRAAEAGLEIQKRKAAELALMEVQRCVPLAEPELAQALLVWSQMVRRHLDGINPVDGVIQSIQKATNGGQRPAWWAC